MSEPDWRETSALLARLLAECVGDDDACACNDMRDGVVCQHCRRPMVEDVIDHAPQCVVVRGRQALQQFKKGVGDE